MKIGNGLSLSLKAQKKMITEINNYGIVQKIGLLHPKHMEVYGGIGKEVYMGNLLNDTLDIPIEISAEDYRKYFDIVKDYDGDYIWDKSINAFRAPKYHGEQGDSFWKYINDKSVDDVENSIGIYEQLGSRGRELNDLYEHWISGIEDPNLHELNNKEGIKREVHGNDIVYVRYKPKFKWFKPPLSIKIFKWEISMLWAFNIDKAYLLKNATPVSPKKSDKEDPKEIVLEWKCDKIELPPEVEKRAKENMEQYRNILISRLGIPKSMIDPDDDISKKEDSE